MNQQLEPERVDMADIADWVRQGKALVHRRLWLFVILTAMHVGISLVTRHMGWATIGERERAEIKRVIAGHVESILAGVREP
ncbi:MAG: hypothetical protein KTR33_09705 [Gammaproteobacteria bacterium]|nr:hypothetical protein [Gammaproteobacteria bacterium]